MPFTLATAMLTFKPRQIPVLILSEYIAGFAGAASATAAGTNYDITVPSTDTHTYSVYQVFTGDLSNGTLSNIKAGQNFNKNNTASKSAADAAAEIAQGTYANNTEKLAAITPYVDLTGTAFGEVSANTALSAPAGYYLLKDKDAVTGDDAATLFIVQVNGPVHVPFPTASPSCGSRQPQAFSWGRRA